MQQGAFFSPILFTLYIDGLFYVPNRVGFGCYIKGVFTSVFLYGDELILLSPSLYALKEDITVCEDYAKRFNLFSAP